MWEFEKMTEWHAIKDLKGIGLNGSKVWADPSITSSHKV